MDIKPIQEVAQANALLFTDHAVRQMAKRSIMDTEAREALLSGQIIEEYPDDKYGPSCLIFGRTEAGRPLHIQCSLPPQVRVITTYEPDPDEWEDDLIRRKANE